MSAFEAHAGDLAELTSEGRRRRLEARNGIDFASNDYLGLAQSEHLRTLARTALERGVPVGAGGSRLLRGNHPEHEALEAEAATRFGVARALFFANGFLANMALFATLPQHGDLVIHDELIHASVREGLKRSRARAQSAAHNDVDSVADGISAYRRAGHTGTVWIAVESLYSMDGDCAPLEELASLADANEAVLVVDEAHATGIFGVRGVGLAHALEGRANVITLHTFGKALGCEGALVCGPETAMDFLVNRARSFIFTTAPSPLIAAIARGALEHISGDHGLQDRLAALVAHAGRVFQSKLGMVPTGTHIQPLIIGENEQTMAVSRTCRDYGFDVRGIRPPTVPDGTSRLRLSLTLNARPGDVDALAAVLENAL